MASDARRRAEEALAKTALLGPIAPASSTWVSVRSDDLAAAEVRAASLSQELLAARDGRDTNRARAEAAEARCAELEALVREVSEGGVEFMDERVRYVAVQIDSETWAKVRALAGGGK